MGPYEQEIIIPSEFVNGIILKGAAHEAGHIVVAHHLEARVFGIGLGFLPERSNAGIFLQAIFGWRNATIENQCIAAAAGPAADLLCHGEVDEEAASGDLQDIAAFTGTASLDPYLNTAKTIISKHMDELTRITDALQRAVHAEGDRKMGLLPNGRTGALLLDERQLIWCLGGNTDLSISGTCRPA
jgi:hypothetical protein